MDTHFGFPSDFSRNSLVAWNKRTVLRVFTSKTFVRAWMSTVAGEPAGEATPAFEITMSRRVIPSDLMVDASLV